MKILEKDMVRTCVVVILAFAVFYVFEINEAHAVTQELQPAMQNLKENIFDGWLWAVKIVAVAVGSAFAIAHQSLTPFGIGAGIGAGIHFFGVYLGDGSTMLI